ncbi:MAG: Spy/CpxP family protein refolding chaperone [Rubritepida sp.]|nr:Spy/CpxP family protein refolding chaperone [Rubritepida sp.]
MPEATGVTTAQGRAATDAHLAQMRGRFKVTPAQVPQWDVFATVSRENTEEMHERFERRRAGLARFDAAQNMADFAQISELHARQLVRLSAAFQALYALMPADQQREADAYFREVRNPERPARAPRRATQ